MLKGQLKVGGLAGMNRVKEMNMAIWERSRKNTCGPNSSENEPIERGTPTFALRKVPLDGHFITFSLCLSVARIDTPPLQPET